MNKININKLGNPKVKAESQVLNKLKSLKGIFEYNGNKINYKSLVNSVPSLLSSTTQKDKRYESYEVGNRGYKLEINKRPIMDAITLYKKGPDYDSNLFKIEFKSAMNVNDSKIIIVEDNDFFEETGINKKQLEKDMSCIYFYNGVDKLDQKVFEYKDNNYSCNQIWDKLGEIPVNELDELDETFLMFNKGVDKFEVWHWIEGEFNVCIAEDLLY